MISRTIRLQLMVFGVITLLTMSVIAREYIDLPRMWFGHGTQELVVEFDDASGLYPGGLVTYRGVKVGRIDRVELGRGQTAQAVVQLDDDARVPHDVVAQAHSASAIGENFIALTSQRTEGPWLEDGAVIAARNTGGILSTGDLLENLTALASSIPQESTGVLMDEVADAFVGAERDVDVLISSAAELMVGARENMPAIHRLFDHSVPFLHTQQRVAPRVIAALEDLAVFTGAVDHEQETVNSILERTPALATAVNGLIADVANDVPVLLADLLSVGQVVKVYLPGVEQTLVVYPALQAALQTTVTGDTAPGSILLGLRPNVNDPPNCYDGFIPMTEQRDFHDVSTRAEVPDDLYCQVAADDPRAVRGARNAPCFNAPGRRAASVEQCLGHEIGDDVDPLGRSRVTATYDPRNGRVVAPGGHVLDLAGVADRSQDRREERPAWHRLLLD